MEYIDGGTRPDSTSMIVLPSLSASWQGQGQGQERSNCGVEQSAAMQQSADTLPGYQSDKPPGPACASWLQVNEACVERGWLGRPQSVGAEGKGSGKGRKGSGWGLLTQHACNHVPPDSALGSTHASPLARPFALAVLQKETFVK